MVAAKERFSAQVETELLDAIRNEARMLGCDVVYVMEDAMRLYIEFKTQTESRHEFVANYQKNELDWEKWDREIEADSAAGKLDFLIEEAKAAKASGTLREL
jgi:hypothetical protein